MKLLFKVLGLLDCDQQKRVLSLLALLVVMASIEALGIISIMPFLALVGNPDLVLENHLLNQAFDFSELFGVTEVYEFLVFLGASSFLFIVSSSIFRTVVNYRLNNFIEDQRVIISSKILLFFVNQKYSFFISNNTSSMMKTIISEVDFLAHNIFRPALNLFVYGFVLIGITIVLVFVNPVLALGAAGLMGFLYLIIFQAIKYKLDKMSALVVNANDRRYRAISEVFGGIKELKVLGREGSYLEKYRRAIFELATNQAKFQTYNQVPTFLIEACIFGALLSLTLVLIATSGGLGDETTLGNLLPLLGLYAFSAYRMKPAAHFIFNGLNSLRYGHAAIDNLLSFLNLDEAERAIGYGTEVRLRSSVRLKNVVYTYPQERRPCLCDVSVELGAGQSIGLVGSTGSGKSTLIDVIMGLLEPHSGDIFIDGNELTNQTVSAWQRRIGYVPQDIFLADASVLENIALGVERKQIDVERVRECAEVAQIAGVIERDLEQGYETFVGENGVKLSGGQRQRIGLARALYCDSDLLIFDEATSALDASTEQTVFQSIRDSIGARKTLIFIAHRLEALRFCDMILLMNEGTIVATGTFEDLARSEHLFQRLLYQKN